jgi:hypothetical protein
MPKANYARRGGVVRVRRKRVKPGVFLNIHVVRRPGPRGGHTVATVHRKRPKR